MHTCRELSTSFERRITTRLLLTVVAVMVAAFLVIYALSWLMVDEDVVKNWISDTHDFRHFVVAGQAIPLGPYPRVAALLAILGTAIFMAFVITTDTLSEDFRNAYIEGPALTAILLLVPYKAVETRISQAAAAAPADQPTVKAAGGVPSTDT